MKAVVEKNISNSGSPKGRRTAMSRKNDPRTDGERKDQKGGGKHIRYEKDKQDAIDTLYEDEGNTDVLTQENGASKVKAQKAKADKAKKADKASKASKKSSNLPADLPASAFPRRMFKARRFDNGNWYWDGPFKTITKAKFIAGGDLGSVEFVWFWYDPVRDVPVRAVKASEMGKYCPD